MKLIKDNQHFVLVDDNRLVIGATDPQLVEHGKKEKLSLVNCQVIENGYDLEDLISNHSNERWKNSDSPSHFNQSACEKDFKDGFQKALEILGDKKFSEEDLREAISQTRKGMLYNKKYEDEYIQSLQPIEWEVEFVMDICGAKVYEVPEIARDEDGCVILKRKEWQQQKTN